MSEWIPVCKSKEVPEGTGKTVSAKGKDIALFNAGGAFYAMDNTCKHMGGPLGEGELNGEIVACPWHGWKYNVKTGVNAIVPTIKVDVFKTKVENGEVFVEV